MQETNQNIHTPTNINKNIEQNKLIEDITNNLENGGISEAKLSTDQKVLARVTDGIYRQPSSAIRELISNAYDADANNIHIETDAPRFENMTIRDDGNGMSIKALANLIYHIGGSAKRSFHSSKEDLGVTSKTDPNLSPRLQRRLIGKIGIGLFSVAQLTRKFTIITKQENTDYYLIADIELNNYSEQIVSDKEKRGESFDTGYVKIRTEHTQNQSAHGTDIILRDIKKSARDQLKSVDLWAQEPTEDEASVKQKNSYQPTFHIGRTDESMEEALQALPQLPWLENDSASEKFRKLYQGMIEKSADTISPKLEEDLDSYLNMLWTLSLSVPLDYVERHPFLLTGNEFPEIYQISNKKGDKSKKIDLSPNSTIKDYFELKTSTQSTDFNVFVDGIQLVRPIRFTDLPSTKSAVKQPLLFIGSATPDLSRYDKNITGGDLSFDAYILWSPKIIPKEHNGVILRVNNASGILFDSTFMKYQVSEYTIRGQLTAEIFVREGLDSALNIDRESFNISHPHYQLIMRWLHDAIRQVINKYKEIKRETLQNVNIIKNDIRHNNLRQVIQDTAIKKGKDLDDIRLVEFNSDKNLHQIDNYVINNQDFNDWIGIEKPRPNHNNLLKDKVTAIIQVLDTFDLLESLSEKDRQTMFEMISKIISVE